MGATVKEIKFGDAYEALDAKYKNALFTLSCRALAEPFNFYRIDGDFSPGMVAYSGEQPAKILVECQSQFRKNGRYSPQTVLNSLPGIGGVEASVLHLTSQDAEIDLPMAFDFFREILGQMVEVEIATLTRDWIHQNKTSEEIRVLGEKVRGERGLRARSTGSDGIPEFEAELMAALENKTFDFPVKPHLAKMRTLIPSYEPGDYIVVTALTGVGKTYYGLNTIYHNAINGVPCCCINLENTPKNIQKRIWQMHGREQFRRDLRGSDAQLLERMRIWDEVKKMPFRSHNPGRNLPAILSTIRRDWNERGIQFAMVDYAQLISVPEYRGNRNYELGEVSAAFRTLALELEIPIMVLAQLKQEVVKYPTKRGGLYDIKDCANFAQDATCVHSLHRPNVFLDEDQTSEFADDYADVMNVKGRETGKAFAKCKFDPVRGFYDDDEFTQFPATPPPFSPALPGGTGRNEDLPF